MIAKPLKIEDLRKIMFENIKKLEKKRFVKKVYGPVIKSAKTSDELMVKGKDFYKQNDSSFAHLFKVMSLFNVSLIFAPKNSKQMITAYANKSAVLQRMRKYEECIVELDKALKITESMSLKIKLLCRKAECLTALGSADNRSYLEKAKFMMTKFEDSEEEKLTLSKMIEKTRSVVDKGKLEIPREEKRKTHALKMIEEVEKRDVSDSIRVEYSEIYGRHLVAARDFKPGEIILTEKPYFNGLDSSSFDHYCIHCFGHLWTAVPCDYCSLCMYCSEKCRTEAWNEHHEMDCFALSCVSLSIEEPEWNRDIPFLVGVFCKALKEAGSIEQLLTDSESFNQFKDQSSNSDLFSTDFTNYKSIFSIQVKDLEEEMLQDCIDSSITALICLAGYTKVLGKEYNTRELKRLAKDDTAMLVGALLLKFSIIFSSGCPTVNLADPGEQDDDKSDGDEDGSSGRPCDRALTLATLHTISSCVPNVESFPAHKNRFVICAILPIKSGEKLIAKLKSDSIWDRATKADRQSRHIKMYGCPCECRACTNDSWSSLFDDSAEFGKSILVESLILEMRDIWNERDSILLEWKANCHKPSFPDHKIVARTVALVTAAWNFIYRPSVILMGSVMLLVKVLRAFHDPSEIYTKVRSLRKQELEKVANISEMTRKILEKEE